MLEAVLTAYGISTTAKTQPHGSGLIHNTWKITDGSDEYLLQRVNHHVFTKPEYISQNIETIASWLKVNHPEYFFVTPVKTADDQSLVHLESYGYFRMFPFVTGSFTYDVAQSPKHACEGALAFGLFTSMLKDFPVENLKITLPDFHNLSYRYMQFEQAIENGNSSRIHSSKREIDHLVLRNDIASTYEQLLSSSEFKLRVTHHDTKISNVLFDKEGKGICVIDLDTVMPGYFISDVGDMMRTYLSPVSEEERDFNEIAIREDFFDGIACGYLREMSRDLTATEVEHFVYSGIFMIYMQALRFLTDYLNDDVYYGATYPGHNHVRAKNQIVLLEKLLEKQHELNKMVASRTANRH
jgi:Ser/Thr protein kinase RdoA (MazF antagonist)